MKHLTGCAALLALGAWLLAAPAWAGDATEPQAVANHPAASTDTTATAVSRQGPEAAQTGSGKVAAQSSAPVPADSSAAKPDTRVVAKADTANSSSDPLASSDPLTSTVIDDSTLSNARGGAETYENQNTSTGAVTGNSASQLTTGSNTISAGSFANTSGIPIVIQNSGNNVLIQNSTILNLQLESPK